MNLKQAKKYRKMARQLAGESKYTVANNNKNGTGTIMWSQDSPKRFFKFARKAFKQMNHLEKAKLAVATRGI